MNIEVEVIRVEAVSRRLDAKWTIAENVTMNVTQGPPTTNNAHRDIARMSDNLRATIWKRITG